MYQIVIVPKNTQANLALGYKTREAAKAAENYFLAQLHERDTPDVAHVIHYEDDYHYSVTIHAADICYILFVDVFESQMLLFDKNMAMDKAAQAVEKKLRGLGFKPDGAAPGSSIIRQ